MKSIRIGNDINIEWSIFRDGTPYVLEELDLSLYLKNIFGRERIEDYAISGNKVMWTFHGKDQEHIGKYTLELVINEQKPGMATTDYVDFVYLTPKTSYCQGEDEENITTETIALSSTMEFAPTVIPYDDTELKILISQKQDELVSGENIKTINGQSILGKGNINIQGGGGSIDPETIEGFIPLSRDFSDDFNNDFAR